MTATYTPIASVTLGASAGSIVFSSVPSTFRDLVIVLVGTTTTTGIEVKFRLNGDTGFNYNFVRGSGNGTSTSGAKPSDVDRGLLAVRAAPTTTAAIQLNINIMDYAQTNKHKTLLSRSSAAGTGIDFIVNRWANLSAVTSIDLQADNSGSWAAGTTAALYGIVA